MCLAGTKISLSASGECSEKQREPELPKGQLRSRCHQPQNVRQAHYRLHRDRRHQRREKHVADDRGAHCENVRGYVVVAEAPSEEKRRDRTKDDCRYPSGSIEKRKWSRNRHERESHGQKPHRTARPRTWPFAKRSHERVVVLFSGSDERGAQNQNRKRDVRRGQTQNAQARRVENRESQKRQSVHRAIDAPISGTTVAMEEESIDVLRADIEHTTESDGGDDVTPAGHV